MLERRTARIVHLGFRATIKEAENIRKSFRKKYGNKTVSAVIRFLIKKDMKEK